MLHAEKMKQIYHHSAHHSTFHTKQRRKVALAGATAFVISLFMFAILLVGCSTSKLSASGQRKTAGKTFVIIGASSGFGRGVAEQLGAYKANVVLAARRGEL